MSLRNQPYFPMYVQDFLTDERLIECSALATGVCIKVMCLMHKSDEYGKIQLKEKDIKHSDEIKNFADKLCKSLPWDFNTIEKGISELLNEGVMQIDEKYLIQKRMVKDNKKSISKSSAGMIGARKRWPKAQLQSIE